MEKLEEIWSEDIPVYEYGDKYCTNDVWILVNGLVSHRAENIKITKGIDIIRFILLLILKILNFRDSLTIASQAINHYRQNYLPLFPEGTFPLVPPSGYFSRDLQSSIGIKWLKYMAHKVLLKIIICIRYF